MAKIKKVIENGGIQYPATITDAVKNPNNGKTVTQELTELGSEVAKVLSVKWNTGFYKADGSYSDNDYFSFAKIRVEAGEIVQIFNTIGSVHTTPANIFINENGDVVKAYYANTGETEIEYEVPNNAKWLIFEAETAKTNQVYVKVSSYKSISAIKENIDNIHENIDDIVKKTVIYKDIEPEETVSAYYSSSGVYHEDSSNIFHVDYYPVSEGDIIQMSGTYKGTIYAFVLLSEKGGVPLSSYGKGNDTSTINSIEEQIILPSGVNWIARSYSSAATTKILKQDSTVKAIVELEEATSNLQERTTKIESTLSEINDNYLSKIELYTDGALEYESVLDGYYYSSSGVKKTISSLSIVYYKVNEGDIVLVKGSKSGNNVASVAYVENIGDDNVIKVVEKSLTLTPTDTYKVISVPSGVGYIAISVGSSRLLRLKLYKYSYDQGENLLDKVLSRLTELEKATSTRWSGKRLLAIGDSITAQKYWQNRVGTLLDMEVRTHAKGGIGIIQMVDGDGSGDAPEGYDPDTFGTSTIYKLNSTDVTDVDILILMGFYNERDTAEENRGEITDMYPDQNTWYGKMNYAVKRVYEELENAGNTDCRVVICSAHKYGKYPFVDKTAYDDGDIILEATKAVADRHSLFFIDLMHNGNINMYNWNKFQSSSTDYNAKYIPSDRVNDGTNKPFDSLDVAPSASENIGMYITIRDKSGCYKSDGETWVWEWTPYIWNGDHLHLNQAGGYRIGDYIAGQLLTM